MITPQGEKRRQQCQLLSDSDSLTQLKTQKKMPPGEVQTEAVFLSCSFAPCYRCEHYIDLYAYYALIREGIGAIFMSTGG